jgi:dimeric dUTPase (all-alpha-NTP-PPase superfamily)
MIVNEESPAMPGFFLALRGVMRGGGLHAGGNHLVLHNAINVRVNMKQKITTMLELQDSMNSKVNPDWRNAGNAWYRAIWIEAAEMLEHYGWKWWKKQQPDIMQVKLEVVDIVHFALSIRLQSEGSLDQVAEGIADEFAMAETADDIKTTIELLAQKTLQDKGAHFSIIAGVMQHLNMPFDELYEIYVGKNVLNMFRQDNGYKEGTYTKIWNGREDNEYLADILQQLNCNSDSFKDDIYGALADCYPAGVAA